MIILICLSELSYGRYFGLRNGSFNSGISL